MRKYYIDNLRWLTVLLLFPFHTFMIYNTFGESFYVKSAGITSTTNFIVLTWPWIMPLLFVIAGMSSSYALKKRKPCAYFKERVTKLLVPLVFGILLIMPFITYFAELFHNGYTGSYIEQYVLFFTKPTDLSGYHGGFTPGHFWFILYLFIISVFALPVMSVYSKMKRDLPVNKINSLFLISLFIIPLVFRPLLDISGKSIGEYFAFFMLGYFVLSEESVLQILDRNRFQLTGLFVAGMVWTSIDFTAKLDINGFLYDAITGLYAWIGILALLGISRHYLNFESKTTLYFSRASFSVYVFHFPWIIIIAFYAVRLIPNQLVQIAVILVGSIPLTFLSYEICKRVGFTRFMFGIKKNSTK